MRLSHWWQAIRSVTTPRVLGVYAIEWAPSADADEVLGRLGGVFHGTIVEYTAGTQLFVADAWWLPPDGDPLGPMGAAGQLRGGGIRMPAARPASWIRRHARGGSGTTR